MLDTERAQQVLTHLEKYKYSSIEHVALSLMWHTMMRVGGVHALDVEDYDAEEKCIEVHHRPETGTPIKNKGDGERLVALSERLCNLLDDWISDKRPDVTDDHGRHPLVATSTGRASKSTLRSYVYSWTRPCEYGADCPHDRDIDTCNAAETLTTPYRPSHRSIHSSSPNVLAVNQSLVPVAISGESVVLLTGLFIGMGVKTCTGDC